jgi:methionine synthase II (cobalamin-independent)
LDQKAEVGRSDRTTGTSTFQHGTAERKRRDDSLDPTASYLHRAVAAPPEITQPPSVESNLPAVFDSGTLVPEPRLATLPSPYLISRAADTQRHRNDLMRELARYVLRPVVEGLAERGYRVVHLQEPWLTFFGIEPSDWASFEEALQELREAMRRTR